MNTVIIQALTPQVLKEKLDELILAESPTFIQVVEMQSARTHFVVIYS